MLLYEKHGKAVPYFGAARRRKRMLAQQACKLMLTLVTAMVARFEHNSAAFSGKFSTSDLRNRGSILVDCALACLLAL
jgi:hypothetical protein